jgi:sugar phosphate isomerase/epimerase
MNETELRFGVSQYTTLPLTFEQDLELFVREGIRYIEVCEGKLDPRDPEPQLRRLAETGMIVSSVQPRLHSLFPDAPRPEPNSPRERMAKLKETIRLFGQHFPGTTLVTIPGAVPGGDFALGYRTAREEYRDVAKAAADHGVRLALEPLNPILMNIDTFIATLKHAGRVIEEVDSPAFGLFVDVWHIWEEANAAELIQKYGGKIFGVHVNDWQAPRAFGDRLLPGAGELPLVELVNAIRGTSYRGAYTLEIFSETHLAGSLWLDLPKTVREGRLAFEKIWAEACAAQPPSS